MNSKEPFYPPDFLWSMQKEPTTEISHQNRAQLACMLKKMGD